MSPQNPGEKTSAFFRTSWNAYRKIIENDYMGHAQAYEKLRHILVSEPDKPFSFLDLACGDAYYSSRALKDTSVLNYTGIDLSEAALSLARVELKKLKCPVELILGDIEDFHTLTRPPLDVIWVGLSLHHLETHEKDSFMKRVYGALSDGGIFLIYEPVYLPGEDRAGYNSRIAEIIKKAWSSLTEAETENLLEHVRSTELPESAEKWFSLGLNAGFTNAKELFSEPSGLYSLFLYRK